MSSRRLSAAEAVLGVVLVGYALLGSYSAAPPTPRATAGDRMNLAILVIAPAAIVGGLLLADAVRRRVSGAPSWISVVLLYLAGPVVAFAGSVAYLESSPNYTVGASTLVFFPIGALLGLLWALAVFARRTSPDGIGWGA